MKLGAWLVALFFAYWQNAYFGHNAFPKSDAELIADGIACILLVLALRESTP